jgi:hypothetical protein
MSHVSIAAALALEDVPAGERLAAFALASFANSDHRAWPGTRVAAARAGLSRTQYLAARDELVKRALVVIEQPGGGRGNSPVVSLTFATTGPWFEGEVNAPLFEAVLSRTATRGSGRLLLGALAALADDERSVSGVTTEQLCRAAGMADSTYRRARAALLASGEFTLTVSGGGRARTNRWVLRDPRAADGRSAVMPRTRLAPPASATPLVAAVHEPVADNLMPPRAVGERGNSPGLNGVSLVKPGQDRTVSPENPAQDRTVCPEKGPGSSGVSATNPAQSRTVSAETPPQTPPETPPPNARAGREPPNQGTVPPNPPGGGGSAGQVTIVEEYLSDRGRHRQRTVVVDLDAIRRELRAPSEGDVGDWRRARDALRRIVGESTFEIWLAQLELIAVDARGCLLIVAPAATRGWIAERFAQAFDRAGPPLRSLRLASDRERQLVDAIAAAPPVGNERGSPRSSDPFHNDQKEAV